MPTYDYGCDACGAQWEVEQRISADPIKKCPTCKKQKARRMITGGNFILKGSGWYADLYHKPATPKSGSKEGGESAPAPAESKSEAKTETKSEAKTEAKPEKPKKKAANE